MFCRVIFIWRTTLWLWFWKPSVPGSLEVTWFSLLCSRGYTDYVKVTLWHWHSFPSLIPTLQEHGKMLWKCVSQVVKSRVNLCSWVSSCCAAGFFTCPSLVLFFLHAVLLFIFQCFSFFPSLIFFYVDLIKSFLFVFSLFLLCRCSMLLLRSFRCRR